LSVAKGLAYSLQAALVGVPTLDVSAAPYAGEFRQVCALIQAGRGRYAAGLYETDCGAVHRVGEYWFGAAPDLIAGLEERLTAPSSPVLVTGELDSPLVETLRDHPTLPASLAPPGMRVRRAGWLAALAWERWHDGKLDNLQTLAPYYIPTASL
jgi:tRNA threonylcarbamoyladenosine biosynthesis protein TsaB